MSRFKRSIFKRHKLKIKCIVYIFIVCIFYFATSYFLSLKYINIGNDYFIKYMLSSSNHNFIFRYSKIGFISKFFSYFTNVDIVNPSSILNDRFSIARVEHDSQDENVIIELKKISKYIEDPIKSNVSNPIVYIYNTHQLENYSAKNMESFNITPNVMMASYMLRERLNKLDINTIVEDGDVTEILSSKGWKYYKSYTVTRSLMEAKVLEQPTLEYFIDLHRDSVARKYTTLDYDGKSYARVLFVVGLENPNYKPNLEFASNLSSRINSKVPNLSKGTLNKQGAGVNGVYNQDFSPNTILIEVGGVDNTIEEVNNTLEVVSLVISEYIKEKKNG